MATILKDNVRKIKFFSSIQTRLLVAYLSIVALVLLLLNTYPLTISRDLIFSSKEASLKNQALLISTSAGALDSLTEDSLSQVMSMLDTDGLSTVIITDADQKVLYEEDSINSRDNADQVQSLLGRALSGFNEFYSAFQNGGFYSSSAVPIMRSSTVTGSVYISEYDREQGEILLNLQNNLRSISFAVCVVAIAFSIFLSKTLTQRITSVLKAIKFVREGEYSYRIAVKGNDEIGRLSDEFNSLTDRLQSTEEIRRRFVADASHELKTPLASIRLLSDSILHNTEMDTDMVYEFVHDIGNEAERLARITEKLLSLTKLDNKIIRERTCVDAGSVGEKVIHILKPIANNSGITLECSFADGCFLWATEDDLYQIMINLVENAIKYNMPNGKVEFKIYKDEEHVFFAVEDTGIGIPEEDLPNIFDRFYRVDKARSREAGGSGLGLSIVKSTVEEYHGTVMAERRERGGMRFVVKFSLYTPEEKDLDNTAHNGADI